LNQSIITMSDITPKFVDDIFNSADHFKKVRRENLFPLHNIGLFFFSSSTRTRVGYAAAMHRLGGSVSEIDYPKNSDSMDNPESFLDTIRSVASYFDVLVIRHNETELVSKCAEIVSCPIINAGSGNDLHPTHALVDLFAIRNLGMLKKSINIGLLGALSESRCAKSLLSLFSILKLDYSIKLIAPNELQLSDNFIGNLDLKNTTKTSELEFEDLDLLYIAGFPGYISGYNGNRGKYLLTPESIKKFKPSLKLLCPLPRIDEISASLDQTKYAYYFQQSDSGLYVRMAVLENALNCSGR